MNVQDSQSAGVNVAGGYGPPGGGGYGGPPPGGGGGYGGPPGAPPGGGGYGGPPGGGGYGGPPGAPPGGGGYGGPPGGGPPGYGGPPGAPPGYGPPPGGGYGPPGGGFGGPPGYGPPGGGFGPPGMGGPGMEKFHPLAITSLVMGILSIPLCCCSFFGAWAPIAAIVCGIIGMQKIKAAPGMFKGGGFCIAGIVTGGVGLMLDMLAIFTSIDDNLKGQYGHF